MSELLRLPDDSVFAQIQHLAKEAGLPEISISESQGKLLHVLIRAIGAKRVLEIGALGGYSGAWIATALPDGEGEFISLELDSKHAAVAEQAYRLALGERNVRTKVIVGSAANTLRSIALTNTVPFDFVFIDADKEGYVQYLELAVPLMRKGGLIVADNTLSHGFLNGEASSPISKFNSAVAADQRLLTALVPIMKHGLDGMSLSIVL